MARPISVSRSRSLQLTNSEFESSVSDILQHRVHTVAQTAELLRLSVTTTRRRLYKQSGVLFCGTLVLVPKTIFARLEIHASMKENIRKRIQEKLNPEAKKIEPVVPETIEDIQYVPAMFDAKACESDVLTGRVYTLKEIAGMLRCHSDTVRRLIKDEPGIIHLNSEYRVPHAVLERVLRRMMKRTRGPI